MDRELGSLENKEMTVEKVVNSIESISSQDWENANYPIISFAPRKLLHTEYEKEGSNSLDFWKEVLNPDHFLNIENVTKYDTKEDFIFIIHTFKDAKGEEIIVKAITTTPELFIEDSGNMINYGMHGFPCENRGGGEYPTLKDFWKDFYDRLSSNDMDIYPIPTKDWRKGKIIKRLEKGN